MRAAVLGSPIAHSLSPALHRAGYAPPGCPAGSTTPTRSTRPGSPGSSAGLGDEWRGLSLTMPLKEVAARGRRPRSTPSARRAAAVNTLVRRDDGGWDATNTDVVGLVRALRSRTCRGAPDRALVLGAGCHGPLGGAGPGRARGHARSPCGPATPSRAADLLAWALDLGPASATGRSRRWAPWVDHRRRRRRVDPAGLGGRRSRPQRPCRRAPRATLLDVVYAGWPTPLARAACGCRHDRGVRARHARAPGRRAVPACSPGSRRRSSDGRRRARGAGAGVTAGLGRARRGPGHGAGGAPHRSRARDRRLPHRRGRGRPRAGAQLVAGPRARLPSRRWRRGRSATWVAGRPCRPTCSSPG